MTGNEDRMPEGDGRPIATIVLAGDYENLGRFREFIRDVCRGQGPDGPSEERIEQIVLAVNEALVNIMRHALAEQPGEPVSLRARVDGRILTAILEDDGCPFDRAAVADPSFDGSRESGFGVFIIEQIADRVAYQRRPEGGNRWELIFTW